MAITISRLAAILKVDDGEFSFANATRRVQNFAHEADNSFKVFRYGLKAAGRTLGEKSLFGGLATGAGVGGAAGLAIGGIALAAEGAKRLAGFMSESVTAAANFERSIGSAIPEFDALTEEWKQFTVGFGVAILPLAREFASILADALHDLNWIIKNLTGRDIEAEMKALANRNEKQKQFVQYIKEAEDVAKQIRQEDAKKAQEEERRWESLKSRAESIRESLRTPGEILKDSQAELTRLFEDSLIGPETLRRGMQRAADEFNETNKRAMELKNTLKGYSPVGAVERFTSAGFSAAAAGREAGRQLEIQKQQLAAENQQVKLQQELVNQGKQKPPQLVRSNF
jgi:hypothetical protein